MYSDAFPAVSPYAAGKFKFSFFEGMDKQTKAIPKKTAGKASKKTEARQSTVTYFPAIFSSNEPLEIRESSSAECWNTYNNGMGR